MNETVLRAAVRVILSESGIDIERLTRDLLRSKPRSSDRRDTVEELMGAVVNPSRGRAFMPLYFVLCDAAQVDGLEYLRLKEEAQQAWLDHVQKKMQAKGRMTSHVPKAIASMHGRIDAVFRDVVTALCGLSIAAIKDAVLTAAAAETDIDWRGKESIPEDYYAL